MRKVKHHRDPDGIDKAALSRVRRDTTQASRSSTAAYLGLHRAIGNQALLRLFHSGALRAKLQVSEPGAHAEIEADRIAEGIVSTPASGPVQRTCTCSGGMSCAACENEHGEGIHRSSDNGGAASDVVPEDVVTMLGPGRPLDPAARRFMEPRFGHEFGDVMLHDDAQSNGAAAAVNARAFTFGRHLVFGRDEYSPHSATGKKLLAHELAHVVQQRDGGRAPTVQRQPAGLPDKRPADKATREEAENALFAFLTRVLAAQGGQTLHMSESIRQAVESLVEGDPAARLRIDLFLNQSAMPSSPAEFARQAAQRLPPTIPRSRLQNLSRIPAVPSKDPRPTSIGEAVGHIVDSTIVPLVKRLPISKEMQTKVIEAARSAIGDGLVGIVDAAMSNAPVDAATKAAIHNAVDAAIKQKGNVPPQTAAGNPNIRQPPPSAVPSGPSPSGETITQSPKIDIPATPAAPKREAPLPATPLTVDQVIRGLDNDTLIPPELRGKPDADKLYAQSQDFADEVARKLDAAQKARHFTVELTISADYRRARDIQAIFDEMARIVRLIANALPYHASEVGDVIVQIAQDANAKTFPLRRVIHLHEGP